MSPRPIATLLGACLPSIWSSAAFQLGCLPPGLRAITCRSFRRGFEDAEPSLALRQPRREEPAVLLPFYVAQLFGPPSPSLPFLFALSGSWPHPAPGLFLPLAPCSSFLDPVSLCPDVVSLPCHISAFIPAHVCCFFLFLSAPLACIFLAPSSHIGGASLIPLRENRDIQQILVDDGSLSEGPFPQPPPTQLLLHRNLHHRVTSKTQNIF